jgi:hypothetical protein
MVKFIVSIAFVAWLGFVFLGSVKQDERIKQQDALLVELEGLHNPKVSKFIDEWRVAYPSPTRDQVTELQILVQRFKNDPASAEQYTATAKQKKNSALPFESLFGTPKAKPGIN